MANGKFKFQDEGVEVNVPEQKDGKKLKVCLLDEDSVGAFLKFGVEGSPAFIIFYDGEEKGRMLGKADKETLSNFILKTLPWYKWGKRK